MGTDEPKDASALTSPVASNGAGANGSGSAKKRLLPMELRRRRKAAKLQITSEKNVATISAKDIIESIQDTNQNTPDDAAPNEQKEANDAIPRTDPVPTEDGTNGRPSGQATVLESTTPAHAENEPETTARETTEPNSTSTTKRLQTLFSFSLQDRKRQKLQHRESLIDVPMHMKLDRVPIDLALKSKVVISMSFAFPFIRPRAASLAKAMSNEPSGSPEVQWLQALQYYSHPASALPTSLNATNERQLEESEFYVNRFRLWQDTFRAAYFGFRRLARHGTLYVRYPDFVVCFYINDGKGEESSGGLSILGICQRLSSSSNGHGADQNTPRIGKHLRAVVSQSNARLRKELHHRGVEFHVPFNLRTLQKPVTDSLLNEDDLSGPAIGTNGTDQAVHGPDSLLQFNGHDAVHGLFEFLLNRKPHSNQDVPEILASHPFPNAAMKSIAVRYMGKTSGRGLSDNISTPASNTAFRSEIELSGICLPSAIARLISCLEEAQKGGDSSLEGDVSIKTALETASMCERMNAIFLDDGRGGASRFGQERATWKQQLDFAKRRLQSVKKNGSGPHEIEMTAR